MGGGLMQLVAYGAQDVYLTGQPQVTLFRSSYKRHTNFSMETAQQTVGGNMTSGGLTSVVLRRTGDLVSDMFIVLQPNHIGNDDYNPLVSSNGVNGVDTCWMAERAFSQVELYIGGQLIDRHYQLWFRLYAEVFMNETKKHSYGKLTSSPVFDNVTPVAKSYVYLPLLFFFNRDPGLALPLIALQYHEVRIDFTLSPQYKDYFGSNQFAVWANYIYLDTAERDLFANKKHEYLIEQVQHIQGDPISSSGEFAPSIIRQNFNHPVKELIWCYQYQNTTANPDSLWNFTSNILGSNSGYITCGGSTVTFMEHAGCPVEANIFVTEDGVEGQRVNDYTTVGPLYNFSLLFNGQQRMAPQLGKYYNQYQPYQYHSGNPYPGIYVYSFALKPEQLQPSGTCNFSRIDQIETVAALKTGVVTTAARSQQMFAVNYNVLKIASGLGGLAFSN